MEMRTRNTSWG